MQSCTACRSVLGHLVKSHTVDACPLRKARYCGLCAIYGHNTMNCPDILTQAYRQPHLMEQLIPPSLLAEFNIKSQTPLASIRIPEMPRNVIMEIPENEGAIRAAILAAGDKPMICQQKGVREKKEMMENKKKLQKIADIAGKKLVYVKDSGTVLTAPTETKKPTAKKGGKVVQNASPE